MANTAQQVLDRDYLDTRAKILHLAASLDRLDRAGGSAAGDVRVATIRSALELLAAPSAQPDRAERVQLLFSRPYEPDWREKLGVQRT